LVATCATGVDVEPGMVVPGVPAVG
jgi:hypothetical protein